MPHNLLLENLQKAVTETNRLTGRWVQLHNSRNRARYTQQEYVQLEQEILNLILKNGENSKNLRDQYRSLSGTSPEEDKAVSKLLHAQARNDRAMLKVAYRAYRDSEKARIRQGQPPVYRTKKGCSILIVMAVFIVIAMWYLLSR